MPDEVNNIITPGATLPAIAEADPELAAEVEKKKNEKKDFEDNVHSFAEYQDDLPTRKPELIANVLRQGHKMILSAPSKVGKSYALIHLAIALVEGMEWLGNQCRKSSVLYLNMEIDDASFKHRISNVYKQLGWCTSNTKSFFIKDLRGKIVKDDLIIRWAKKCGAEAIIIDPVYKLNFGSDENSAGEMGKMCRFFDVITEETGASLIYAHHYAKGNASVKDPLDRASGSGVFARDPDAILTLSKLAKEDCYRLEYSLREFPPHEPTSVRKDDILLVCDSSLKNMPLKGISNDNDAHKAQEKQKRKATEREQKREKILDFVRKQNKKIKKTDLYISVSGQLDVGRDAAKKYVQSLIDDGKLIETGEKESNNTKWISCPCVQETML